MKTRLIILLPLILASCQTRYIEKNSPELSQAVWGAKRSIEVSRYDLAEKYTNEAAKLVPAPEKPHQILPIYEN